MQQCSVRTKKGRPCPFNADRMRKGVAYCHVHDPEGVYQRQNRGELPRVRMDDHHSGAAPKPLESSQIHRWPDLEQPTKAPMITGTLPPIQLDPNWHRADGCPFEPGVFHQFGAHR